MCKYCKKDAKNVKVIVFHGSYGCDTGCCAHIVQLGGLQTSELLSHPEDGEDPREFAEALVSRHFGEEHVKDLDWEKSEIVYEEGCYNCS